jgi:hypothetical protein
MCSEFFFFNYVGCQEIVFIKFECLMCVIPGPFFQEPLFQKKKKKKKNYYYPFLLLQVITTKNFLSPIFELYTPQEKT